MIGLDLRSANVLYEPTKEKSNIKKLETLGKRTIGCVFKTGTDSIMKVSVFAFYAAK